MEAVTAVLIFCSLVAAASGGYRIVDFTEHPVSQEVAVNDAVTLQCSISTPGATVTHWVFNGDQLSSGSGIDISGDSLTVSSFQTSHAGEYRCAAGTTDGFFQLSHAATLTHFGQRSFITQPEDFTVYLTPITGESTQPSRETAALQCEIERAFNGNLPVITWELRTGGEGSAVTSLVQEFDEDTSRATFQYDHIGYFQLFFPIEASDGTEVRCVATGPGGLIVRSNWATIIISDQQTPPDTPVFSLQAPEEVHFIGDQNLILGCSKTSANDSFGIRWFRNFQTAFYTQGFTPVFLLPPGITLHGPTNIVLNVSMREQFEGDTFSCQVRTNDFEPATRNTNITVPPDPLPPVVYTDISSGNVSLRHTFSTTITLPTPYSGAIQWFFNGVAVSTSGSKYSVDSSDGSLTISDITMDDEGIYQAELLDPSPPQFVNFFGIIDLGECTNTPAICGVNAACTLTEAGFICSCLPGYAGAPPTTACQDIDECEEDINNCQENEECTNVPGSFICTCAPGYEGDPPTTACQDIDECEDEDINNCHENAECANVAGSFICTCEDDYTGNGTSCILSDDDDDDGGLAGWAIALIVIFLILALICCYFLFCFLCLCWRKRWRNYYAEEKEKKYHEFRVEMEDGSYEEKKTIV